MKRISIILAAALFTIFGASALPAKPGYRTYTQPDGTTITLELRGNQHAHAFFTEDNVPVLCDNDGFYRYADVSDNGDIKLSAIIARNLSERTPDEIVAIKDITAEKLQNVFQQRVKAKFDNRRRVTPQNGLGLFTVNYPRTGKVHGIVILVEYSDIKFSMKDPATFFYNSLNKEGFSEYGATGSARDYFLDQSNGLFDVTFDVYGPVTLSQNRRYYGQNDAWGNDAHPEEMVIEATELLDDVINFADYDYDDDGNVDNIYLIYAGTGEADGGPSDSVWPHSWDLASAGLKNLKHDGKNIFGYACSNEIQANDGIPDGIGSVCHEFSHVMGLPDLYSTDYDLSVTPSSWDVMDAGSYNNNSRTPPGYSAYERNALGWTDPIILSEPESVTLEAIHKSNTTYLIPTEKTTEFFLIENRQQEGWDKYLPYHGMLIWHIDFVQSVWDSNVVNNTTRHQYVDIVEANNNANNRQPNALRGYPFPGTSKNTSFTSETTPALVSWSGRPIDLPITDITETADGLIKFNVKGGRIELDTPDAPVVSAKDNGTLEITWQAVDKANDYLLDIYQIIDNEKTPFGDYSAFHTGDVTAYSVDGVEGETTYYVTITAAFGRNYSEASPEAVVTTPYVDIIYSAPTALSGAMGDNGVLLSWLPLKNATEYLLTIEAEAVGDEQELTLDFGSDNTLSLPDGWTWTGESTDIYKNTSTGYFGEEAPALKFAKDGVNLTSPEMAGAISKVSFWLRGASANSISRFYVEGRNNGDDTWAEIFSVPSLASINGQGAVQEFSPESDIRQLRFVYAKSSGNAAFDDLKLVVPTLVFNPIEEYTGYNVGPATEYTATIADGISKIRFYVEAQSADGHKSKPSNYVTVDLSGNTSINSATITRNDVSVRGNDIIVKTQAHTAVNVVNIAGAVVASTTSDADGVASLTMPAGFYIVISGNSASKIIVK
ncbi:MAG: M6 family metalloprotease domain-containing protein [Muribaculaceae bacterium]|nr:M6 family metalloprotease domain-containing protein [Muribaculaceae bacterium]